MKREDVLTVEILEQDEKFISISMQATQIALRNHQEEKIEALKNCVINSVIQTDIDENKAIMLIVRQLKSDDMAQVRAMPYQDSISG